VHRRSVSFQATLARQFEARDRMKGMNMAGNGMPNLNQYSRISALKAEREPWRIRRLRRLLSSAGKAAGTNATRAQLRKAIARIRDEKGDLLILWDGAHFDFRFVELVREGWRSLGEFAPPRNMVVYR
jgi:hypothetical protein